MRPLSAVLHADWGGGCSGYGDLDEIGYEQAQNHGTTCDSLATAIRALRLDLEPLTFCNDRTPHSLTGWHALDRRPLTHGVRRLEQLPMCLRRLAYRVHAPFARYADKVGII